MEFVQPLSHPLSPSCAPPPHLDNPRFMRIEGKNLSRRVPSCRFRQLFFTSHVLKGVSSQLFLLCIPQQRVIYRISCGSAGNTESILAFYFTPPPPPPTPTLHVVRWLALITANNARKRTRSL